MSTHHSQVMEDPFEAVSDPREARAQRIITCFANMTNAGSAAVTQAAPSPPTLPVQDFPHNPEEEWVDHLFHAYNAA